MGWNSKSEVGAILLALFGLPLLMVVVFCFGNIASVFESGGIGRLVLIALVILMVAAVFVVRFKGKNGNKD